MTRKPRLMILGAGRHQVPLIRRAAERGIDTVVIDPYEDSPGKVLATIPVVGDAMAVNDVRSAASEYGVDGLATVGTDQAVLPWAIVAEELGLPCHVTPDAALAATNKTVMRSTLSDAGVLMPAAVDLGPDSSLDGVLGLPVVVKAADSQGQRGMTLVNESSALVAAVKRARVASPTQSVVLESFHHGPEVTINAWIEDGMVQVMALLDRITFNPPSGIGICFQHVGPSVHSDREHEFRSLAGRIASAFKLRRGPIYAQCIVCDDAIRVIEAAVRVGGGHEAQLLPRILGFNLLDRTIDLALGHPATPWEQRSVTAGLVNFVLARPGRFASLSAFDGADEAAWYVGIGHEQGEVSDSLGRVGYFIVTGDDRQDVIERARLVYQGLNIKSADGSQLVFWPDPIFVNEPRLR